MKTSTGIPSLDARLDGGIFPGTLVAVTLSPGSQYGPLMGSTRDDPRSSLVLTTIKSEAVVDRRLDRTSTTTDVKSIRELNPGEASAEIFDHLDVLNEAVDLHIDTIDPVEKTLTTERYIELLNTLSERLADIGTIGYLYAYRTKSKSYNRIISLDIADIVLELDVVEGSDRLGYRLSVLKSNGVPLSDSERVFEFPMTPESST